MRLFSFVSILATAAALGLSACGDASPPGATGGSSGSGTGGASGGAGSGGAAGAAGQAGSNGQTVTLTMGPFDVPAGREVYKCQTFRNPFGADTDIKAYESHMSRGSHHMFLFFYDTNADGPVTDCAQGGFEFHPYPYSTQSPDMTITYPDTVGSLIPATTGLLVNAHYVNTTQQTISATVTVVLHLAEPGTVTQHAGVVFMNNVGIMIGPQTQPQTASSTCNIPFDMKILGAGSHMHQRATDFVATANGMTLFQTQDWSDPPPMLYSPALELASGTPVNWTCTYVNDTGQTLHFGESAINDVMCIFSMQYFPVPAGRNPTVTCMNF